MNRVLTALLLMLLVDRTLADDRPVRRMFVSNERLALGTQVNRSASVRIRDMDGDQDADIVIANGRHWPGQNYLFLNQGRSRFTLQRKISHDQSTTYAAEPADLDGDGDLDLAIGNDMAENHVMFNDGHGRFSEGGVIGSISSVRSLTVADIDSDGDMDVLLTCRGRANQICLNDGKGNFTEAGTFGTQRDSTIDVEVVDWNNDKQLDLVLANRDGQANCILLNDGRLNFSQQIPFGTKGGQTRSIEVADMNTDGHPDIVTSNIGQANRIYFSDGNGGVAGEVKFGQADDRSYSIAIADLNNDNVPDIVVGNVAQQNAVYLNNDNGSEFTEIRFGDASHATYSVDTGDLDGDGFPDIAVANSDGRNFAFLNRPAPANRANAGRPTAQPQPAARLTVKPQPINGRTSDVRVFNGTGGTRVAADGEFRSEWNVNEGEADGILWSIDVPGLSHSSPVVAGNRIYLTTAVSSQGDAPLKVGQGGRPDAADDNEEQSWMVLCYDHRTGKKIWSQTARTGKPKVTRHVKATHANTSVAIAGENIVAFFGSEGMYCYDLDGNLKWSRDLGVINISKYGIGWGFASSPAIHGDHIVIVCDDPENPFVAGLQLSDGQEIWRTSRQDICERSWATPYIHSTPDRTQAVINGWPWIVSYDVHTGKELWRIKGGGDNPVPTPFCVNDLIYITNAHGAESPIFVVKPDATGDITPSKDEESHEAIVWSTRRGGSYMSTPVVYGDHLYLGNTNGVLRCFNATSGEKVYEKRLGTGAAIYSSLVAADGKIFCPSENGTVYVVKAGADFEVLAENEMGDPLFATPTVAEGVLFFRTTRKLIAVQ